VLNLGALANTNLLVVQSLYKVYPINSGNQRRKKRFASGKPKGIILTVQERQQISLSDLYANL
jgi:hypothetical protein